MLPSLVSKVDLDAVVLLPKGVEPPSFFGFHHQILPFLLPLYRLYRTSKIKNLDKLPKNMLSFFTKINDLSIHRPFSGVLCGLTSWCSSCIMHK